jgi:outer membrane protein OmpA-like peptidoglycan-associated protein
MINVIINAGQRCGRIKKTVGAILPLFVGMLFISSPASGQKQYDIYPAQNTVNRSLLPVHMKVVSDPWSSKPQPSPDEISAIRRGYWRYGGKEADSISVAILNFRVRSTTLEKEFMNNERTLNLISRTLSDEETLAAIDFIIITGAASPEGNTHQNERLAEGRARAVKSYIMWQYPFMDRDKIYTFSIGEDWSGLRRMVEEDRNTPYRSEVLTILDSGRDSDAKRSMLRALGRGDAWRYISRNMLPKLRGAATCMIYYKEDRNPIVVTEIQRDTIYVDRYLEQEKTIEIIEKPVISDLSDGGGSPYYWAVKTNLLYDAVLLPDLALEFSVGNRWSFEANAQWSWWATQHTHHNCWRIQLAGIEGRYWLGDRTRRTPLSGHHIGLYTMAGTYDVRLKGGTGYLSNMSYSAGISYGYSMPVGRSWSLEFGLGVGYFGGEYDTYYYNEDYDKFPRKNTYNKSYFGPTKARISLVWLPGGKNEKK